MTPKEKAQELFDSFDYPNIKTGLMYKERKECALICVVFLNRQAKQTMDSLGIIYETTNTFEYWNKVKQEINNL